MTISGTSSRIGPYHHFSGVNPWLRRFSKLTCLSTLFLIFAGAMVKSTDSGLAVPDWPLSYGMVFPPMVGGVFYEHGHRMVAATVGLMTLVLAVWLGMREPRRWVRNLGYAALSTVISQGLLGGITVLFFLPKPVSILHGILAQIFFILTIVIAYSQSTERKTREFKRVDAQGPYLQICGLWIILIIVQLVLGALMRHTGSGLAMYGFPKMAGQWVPTFDTAMLARINDWRFDHNLDLVTRAQVIYHFLHRLGAFIIILAFCALNYTALRHDKHHKKARSALILIDILVVVQIMLGGMTVLMLKNPVTTSLHVVTGAAILGVSVLLFLRVSPLSLKQCTERLRNK